MLLKGSKSKHTATFLNAKEQRGALLRSSVLLRASCSVDRGPYRKFIGRGFMRFYGVYLPSIEGASLGDFSKGRRL